MIIAGEKGAQCAVHESAGQNLIITSLALTLCESSGETAGSGIFLAVLYLQGHKICSRYGILGSTYCGKQHRIVHTKHYRAISLLGQLSGLDADGSSIRQLDSLCNYVHLVDIKYIASKNRTKV